jgi:hypothetical protein
MERAGKGLFLGSTAGKLGPESLEGISIKGLKWRENGDRTRGVQGREKGECGFLLNPQRPFAVTRYKTEIICETT